MVPAPAVLGPPCGWALQLCPAGGVCGLCRNHRTLHALGSHYSRHTRGGVSLWLCDPRLGASGAGCCAVGASAAGEGGSRGGPPDGRRLRGTDWLHQEETRSPGQRRSPGLCGVPGSWGAGPGLCGVREQQGAGSHKDRNCEALPGSLGLLWACVWLHLAPVSTRMCVHQAWRHPDHRVRAAFMPTCRSYSGFCAKPATWQVNRLAARQPGPVL